MCLQEEAIRNCETDEVYITLTCEYRILIPLDSMPLFNCTFILSKQQQQQWQCWQQQLRICRTGICAVVGYTLCFTQNSVCDTHFHLYMLHIVAWINLAQNRVQWQSLVNTLINENSAFTRRDSFSNNSKNWAALSWTFHHHLVGTVLQEWINVKWWSHLKYFPNLPDCLIMSFVWKGVIH